MATAFAVAAASTTMATTDILIPRLPTHCSALPSLPSRFSTSVFPTSLKKISMSRKSSQLQIKASSSEESAPVDGGEILTDLKEKWDAVEDKSNVLLYGGGALFGIWLSSIIVGAINSVPLSSRKELAADIESLKKKIAGTE